MENLPDRHTHATMSPARIETLADGVFAIAMTLLAFDLVVPEVAAGPDPASELPGPLFGLSGRFALYAISFVALGVYWVRTTPNSG